MTAGMAAAQGYSDVIFLRGDHLSCLFLPKAQRACQSAFNDENKNDCKGKMFWLTRSVVGLSGYYCCCGRKQALFTFHHPTPQPHPTPAETPPTSNIHLINNN